MRVGSNKPDVLYHFICKTHVSINFVYIASTHTKTFTTELSGLWDLKEKKFSSSSGLCLES